MKILLLSTPELGMFLKCNLPGHTTIITSDKITATTCRENRIDFIISYGYRHKITKDVLNLLSGKVINMHISYLPYNRGADPNFWSFIEDTPKGVTIHQIDENIDTGPILVRKKIDVEDTLSLRDSYAILQHEIKELFKENINSILSGDLAPIPQQGHFATHRLKDKEKYINHIPDWLDMPANVLVSICGEIQMSHECWRQPR